MTEGEDRLLAALLAGVSATGYAMLARSAGVEPDAADELLKALEPALEKAVSIGERTKVAVLGDSALARAIAGLLAEAGVLGVPDDASLVVLVADWVLSPVDHFAWLNRDVVHVPVVVSERAVTVGPFVQPGVGPCLYCVQLTRTDADAAWPAIATQLWGRAGRELDHLTVSEAAAFLVRRVLARLGREAGGEAGAALSWRIGAEGEVSVTRWGRHPDCRCAVPEGTDWVAVPSGSDANLVLG
ncbi:hypothetical protein [Pseudolysinimonas sp.]|uniref:hypothetical protein n=1 Tax=Pseudolysinimonas sp. TaxID=2680009 RepID=UPI003263CE76